MFRVLITGSNHPYKEAEKDFLKDIAEVIVNESKDKSVLLRLVEDVDAILTDVEVIDREIFDHARKVRVVVEYGIGVDNIDLKTATEKGVMVCNVPAANVREVAEHTIALTMCLTRDIVRMDSDVRRRHVWDFNLYEPTKLDDKNWGIIGFGKIGREVARLMKTFCSRIMVYDPLIEQKEIRRLGYEPSDFETILRQSDVISIHIPLIDGTRGMIGAEQLNMMKKTAFLVNVSRGGIIHERDLYEALKDRKIGGAALDVLTNEPEDTCGLGNLENIVITPHAAWKSEKASYNVELAAVAEVKNVLTGNPPMNLVNKDVQRKVK
jgi:D-3-phosphoglycerate dehydrogenase